MNKCNANMSKLTKNYTVRFNDEQVNTLSILQNHNICIAKFITQAISEKIKRDWKQIKEQKQKVLIPF
jgi:hypothetical protein